MKLTVGLLLVLAGLPALAQMDFSGEWAPVQDEDNTGNPYIGEFIGIPLSHASLLRSDAGKRPTRRCRSGSAGRMEPCTSRAGRRR